MDRARLVQLLDQAERMGYVAADLRAAIMAEADASPDGEIEALLVRDGRLRGDQYKVILETYGSTHVRKSPLFGIGKYVIRHSLSSSGDSRLYKAWDNSLKRWAVLRVLNPGGRDPEQQVVDRFWQEARALARLTHPNIVPIYEVGEADNIYFIAARCVEGTTAGEMAPSLQPRRAAEIVRDAARAIGHAHAGGIIHRDIRPSSIRIEDKQVWVVGFTLSQGYFGGDSKQIRMPSPYQAPELGQGAAGSASSDIYALGAVLYFLSTRGAEPFDAGQPWGGVPVHPRKRRADLDPALCDVILRCLELSPEKRYQTAAQFGEDLDRWLEGYAPRNAPHKTSRVPKLPPPPPPRRARAAALFLFMAAVAVALVFTALPGGPAVPPAPRELDPAAKKARGESKMAEARRTFGAGKLGDCVAAARQARADLGDLPDLDLLEGRALRLRSDLDGAERCLARVRDLPAALLELGLVHLQRWEAESGCLTPQPQPRGGVQIGMAEELASDVWPREAAAVLEKMPDGGLSRGERALRDAALAFLRREDGRAIEALDAAPDAAEFALWRGRWLQLAGRHDEAVAAVDAHLKRVPEDAHAWVVRGVSLLGRQDWGGAAASCARALAIDPRCAHARHVEGVAHHVQIGADAATDPHTAPALESYARAIDHDPTLPAVYLARSLLRLRTDELEGALADVNVHLKLRRKSAAGYGRRAAIHLKRNETQKAIDDLSEAVRINSAYFQGYADRGAIYMQLRSWDDAVRDFDRAIDLQVDAAVLARRGACHYNRERWAEAVQDLERAIVLDSKLEAEHGAMLADARRKRGR